MSGTVRLTAAQALVRWLAAQRVEGFVCQAGGA
jgi:TPP-dependent trihydroxycyclohexane-1,2-dione (THcHDO) dehydratase